MNKQLLEKAKLYGDNYTYGRIINDLLSDNTLKTIIVVKLGEELKKRIDLEIEQYLEGTQDETNNR